MSLTAHATATTSVPPSTGEAPGERASARFDAGDRPVDGRVMRRSRNMYSVRRAVIELLAEGADLSIPMVADRAGVAGRSVYRYFGDLHGAVRDAVLSRLEAVTEELPNPTEIDTTRTLDERLAEFCRRRVEMWWAMAPVLGHVPDASREQAMQRFDEVAIATFAPELARLAHDVREWAESSVAVAVRMRSIDAVASRHGNDPIETAKALCFTLERLLAPVND